MNEIEKMYKNAGIKPTKNWQSCLNCKLKTETRYNEWGEEYLTCNRLEMPETCSDAKEYYPLFTAEKQLELIKFITSLGVCEIENWNDKGFHFAIKRERIYPTMFLSLSNINLQETLTDVINNLWQDLTEEEKQQVKGILK